LFQVVLVALLSQRDRLPVPDLPLTSFISGNQQDRVALGVEGLRASPKILLSGGFGSGHREAVVGEVGDELQVPAECLHVACDGLDGG